MKDLNIHEEFKDWIEALENTLLSEGSEYTEELLEKLYSEAKNMGLEVSDLSNPPFKNTVLFDDELPYPGDWDKEEKLDTSSGGIVL